MGARPILSDEQLRNITEDVTYEVQMLFAVSKLLSKCQEPFLKNIAIESFLIHYRNVRDFLFPTKSIKEPHHKNRGYQEALDTVIAYDFNQDWNCEATNWSEIVSNERERINKQLSHLSYSRPKYDKSWPWQAMRNALMKEFERFLKTLPKEKQQLFSRLYSIFPSVFQ